MLTGSQGRCWCIMFIHHHLSLACEHINYDYVVSFAVIWSQTIVLEKLFIWWGCYMKSHRITNIYTKCTGHPSYSFQGISIKPTNVNHWCHMCSSDARGSDHDIYIFQISLLWGPWMWAQAAYQSIRKSLAYYYLDQSGEPTNNASISRAKHASVSTSSFPNQSTYGSCG